MARRNAEPLADARSMREARPRFRLRRTPLSILSRLFGTRDPAERSEPASVAAILSKLDRFPPERARFLAAFSFTLSRVAHSDLHVDEAEIQAMEGVLEEHSDLSGAEAALVIEIAVTQAGDIGGGDNYVVVREFRRSSEREHRIQLMRCLFVVAAADDTISTTESSAIHQIGEELGFTRPEVNALRLEWRDKLAELKPRESL
jgi:uncharacterized tellurite resistance protein B-like protein